MRKLNEILNLIDSAVLLDFDVVYGDNMPMLYEAKKFEPEEEPKASTKALTHLDHVEDLFIRHGHDGLTKALGYFHGVSDYLRGKKKDGFGLSMKMDGSPSLVWGRDPHSKKFFVGTKSFFNKTPKVNFTDKDVDTNHGKAPGLANKLKLALAHLKDISPKDGIYQGDLMYSSDDVYDNGDHYAFTPNTITYKVKKDSAEGEKVGKSKLGVAPHAKYARSLDGELKARYGVDTTDFKPHPSVHLMSTKLSGKFEYSNAEEKRFLKSLSAAQKLGTTLRRTSAYDTIKDHEALILGYINKTVKDRRDPSFEGYIGYLKGQYKDRIDNLKLDKSKKNTKRELDLAIQGLTKSKSHLNNIFSIHKHLADAKATLVDVLSKKSPYGEEILGSKSKPEGFVASIKDEPVKFVDRKHFSASNFDWNEKVNPSDNPTVLTWGRFNPATSGHEKLIKTANDIARKQGGRSLTVASRTSGNAKNPLSPADKLKWLKTLFPGQEIAVAGEKAPTLLAQMQQLHNQGVRHLTIVAGQDKVDAYTRILAKYNGKKGLFHFKRVRVVSAGERNPESMGVDGVSGTKARDAAKSGKFDAFKKTLPKHVAPNKAKELFGVLKAEMGHIKVDKLTPHKSLKTLSKSKEHGKAAKQQLKSRV